MKRQTENVRSIVYQYGSVSSRIAPVLGEEQALAQLRLAPSSVEPVGSHRARPPRPLPPDHAR